MGQNAGVLAEVARAAQLREGPAGVAALLRELYRQAPLATKELARRLGWPVPVTAAVRRELERAGLLERTPAGSTLGERGQRFAREVLGLFAREDPLCPTCAGRRFPVDPARWGGLLARLEAVHRANPAVDTTLDQSHGTPETALRRALAMVREGALEGKDVLILGDDDLVSVAIGLLALPFPPVTLAPFLQGDRETRGWGDEGTGRRGDEETGRWRDKGTGGRLVVVDVDERFLEHIAAAGRAHGFAVETVEHDLRDPLPGALREAFDTVETDPPYTIAGLRLFLSRALEGLRPGAGRDVFVSYAPRDPAGQRALLQACVKLGLAPYTVTPDFNRYVGSTTLGGSGQFLHLRTTAEARPTVEGRYEGALYTMDERLAGAAGSRPAQRAYRCLGCGATYRVGVGGDFPRIEVLKERGCPQCGGSKFRAGRRREP